MDELTARPWAVRPGTRYRLQHRSGMSGSTYWPAIPVPEVGTRRRLVANGVELAHIHGVVVEVEPGSTAERWSVIWEVMEGPYADAG